MHIRPKRFNFRDVRGISQHQLEAHYQLYLGYIDLIENIMNTMDTERQTDYELRGLKEGETYALNGIVLHEYYFENLGLSDQKPSSSLIRMMERDFGSYQNWFDDFLRVGRIARGWAILAYDFRDGRLHNIMQDAHNQGDLWQAEPLLVLDVYEHAYLIEFGIDKKEYLQVFADNIDWSVVNERFSYLFR